MKIILTSLIALCIPSCIYSQIFIKDTTSLKYSTGFYNNLLYHNEIIDKQTNEKAKLFSLEVKPYFTYHFNNNIGIGFSFSYEFFSSNYYKKKSLIECGLIARYVMPVTINKSLLKKIHFYVEIGYYKTNYLMCSETVDTFIYKTITINENFIISNKLNKTMVCLPIGMQISIWNGIYFDLRWQYNIYIEGTNINGFTFGVGYRINRKA